MGCCCCCCKRPSPEPAEPIRPPLPPKQKIVVGIHNFRANDSRDLSFNKGDRMKVLEDHENEWILVKHLSSLRQGFIPVSFVAEELSLESYAWFFHTTSRKEAEILLLGDVTQPPGTYLIRPTHHDRAYSLSVKDRDLDRGDHVRHYKIQQTKDGKVYLTKARLFKNLPELVSAITTKLHSYDFVLTDPCKKPEPTITDLSSNYRDKWEINRSEIQMFEMLGSGHYGQVFRGIWNGNLEVAVKKIVRANTSNEFLKEAGFMKKLRHQNLVQLYGVCTFEEPLLMVLEFMENGSVKNYLRKDKGQTVKFEDLISIAYQVATGMSHLEKNHFIHRDLAARNVLVSSNLLAKICDFGLANMNKEEALEGERLPIKWTAPEAIESGKFTHKSDVWSYGVFLIELFTYGETPYNNMQNDRIVEMVKAGCTLPKPKNYPLPDIIYEEIILQCWHQTPIKRPTFKFLADYFDFMDITYKNIGDGRKKIIITPYTTYTPPNLMEPEYHR